MSLVATFDDLMRCMAVLADGTAEEEFLKFVKVQEECRMQWLSAIQEAQRLQRELDASLENMADLEAKLYHARKLIETEHKARKEAEHERDKMEKKMIAVAELVQNERDIKDETRDKFAFLNSFHKKRKSGNAQFNEKFGNEINSTGSFLSDLSLTQSEEDFLDRKPANPRKKNRPSYTKATGAYVGGKRSRSEGRKSKSRTMEISATDKIVAQTKVSIPPEGRGPIHAESTIEAIPQIISVEDKGNDNHLRSTVQRTLKRKSPTKPGFTPSKSNFTPSAPTLQEINTPVYEFKKNFGRNHNFTPKTFLKSDFCAHCQKKIRFGSLAQKCRECRICLHTDCKEQYSKVCASQSVGTPTTVKGMLRDYVPHTSPMIPALIIHCVDEIETRGLTEIGIYRVSASEREVKALKERFLRSKSVPFLGNIDVHVLCGCLKDFLRGLREPLIPTNLWKDFTNAVQSVSTDALAREVYQAISKLPQPNRDTLAFLILHLQRVACCEEVKMPTENLARIFGPTIVGYSTPDPDQHAIFTETMIQFTVMEALMNIPADYWSQFVQTDSDQQHQGTNSADSDPIKHYGTPLKGLTAKKQRKFYESPLYHHKKK